jgi:hypothetical protein
MVSSRLNVQGHTLDKDYILAINFHQRSALKDVKTLSGFVVMVALFTTARRHSFFNNQ